MEGLNVRIEAQREHFRQQKISDDREDMLAVAAAYERRLHAQLRETVKNSKDAIDTLREASKQVEYTTSVDELDRLDEIIAISTEAIVTQAEKAAPKNTLHIRPPPRAWEREVQQEWYMYWNAGVRMNVEVLDNPAVAIYHEEYHKRDAAQDVAYLAADYKCTEIWIHLAKTILEKRGWITKFGFADFKPIF
jgi:exonuclease VII large subunit